MDGVNNFIANPAEGLKLPEHDAVPPNWGYRGVRGDELSRWFKVVHWLDFNLEMLTLKDVEER